MVVFKSPTGFVPNMKRWAKQCTSFMFGLILWKKPTTPICPPVLVLHLKIKFKFDDFYYDIDLVQKKLLSLILF